MDLDSARGSVIAFSADHSHAVRYWARREPVQSMAWEPQGVGGVDQVVYVMLSLCGRHSSNRSDAGRAFNAHRLLYERFCSIEATLQRSWSFVGIDQLVALHECGQYPIVFMSRTLPQEATISPGDMVTSTIT
jgi:hypothetical protein